MPYISFLIALLIFCSYSSPDSIAAETSTSPDYALTVSFDIPHSRIEGMAGISVPEDKEVVLEAAKLKVLDVYMDGKKIPFTSDRSTVIIRPGKRGVLEIKYEGEFAFNDSSGAMGIPDNVISGNGIFLTGVWYPRPDRLMHYRLHARLPAGYETVSEADRVDAKSVHGRREFTFFFDHPVDHLNLIASDRFKVLKESHDGIELYAYFFKEDLGLAKEYLEHAKGYFDLYQKMLTPYPYRRFSIVENILPTGYSMPTFTLLGQDVVRLPFIVRTSLGHEILHQWFGNSVYIDYARGNWAEGLTTYLADHLYAEQKGEGADYRKQVLIDYQSYVNKENVFPLRDFMGRTDNSSKSIGYGKGAMIFHMLKMEIGEERFRQALRHFIKENDFRKASWSELRSAFETISATDLSGYFDQWLDRTSVPVIEAGKAAVRQKGDNYAISLPVNQAGKPFRLNLPVTIYSSGKKVTVWVRIDKEIDKLTLSSQELPEKIVIDENYDVMRQLSEDEYPPVIARILGDRAPVLVLPQSDEEKYKGIVETFVARGAAARKASDIDDSILSKDSLIVLSNSNTVLERISEKALKKPVTGGFSLNVINNPFNPDKVVAVINAESAAEADAAFPKIFHYGKYSRLSFSMGKNILKEINTAQKGIPVTMEAEALAVHVPDVMGLSKVIKDAGDRRIIYVGENHDSFADHAVQLEFIKELSKSGTPIAIGMEMFQRPFQPAIDDYIKGSIDQSTFLKRTEYFKRWGFDYDLYKPILDYAREKQIPVVALNIEKEIVDSVAKKGLEGLTKEYRSKVPRDMDLADSGYKERLRKVFDAHDSLKERNFDYFYQSQILWDETMAESVADYLSAHPDHKMIVLAGNGHLTYRVGIPDRAARRIVASSMVVLTDSALEKGIADYVVFPKHIEGKKPVRMMVFLEEEKDRIRITSFPANSISKKAGIMEGDIILSLDGTPIHSIDDAKIYLLEKKKGENMKVRILRGAGASAKEMDFDLKL